MVDVNNGLVGIVGALTGKNEKDKFYMYRACIEGEMREREAREGEKGNGWGRKKGRENWRYENGEERWREK